MDERTMLNLASFYDAIMKTNYDYGKNIYLYVIIFVIILLVGIIICQVANPRVVYIPIAYNPRQYQPSYRDQRLNNITY
jgi:hypothetical protein